MSDTGERPLLCSSSRKTRTITFYIREGFGDGKDYTGIMLSPDTEVRELHNLLDDSLAHLGGKGVLEVERWVRLKLVKPEEAA